jgi:20S proteasome subunit beta 7
MRKNFETSSYIKFYRVGEYYTNDGHVLRTQNIYEYLSRVMYGRRSRFNPLWNSYIVGGYNDGEK